jgi:hypothetical protein
LLTRKIERIKVKPSNISTKDPLEAIEDAVVEADQTSVTPETQNKVHWQKESRCSRRTKSINSDGSMQTLTLYSKFIDILPNKRKRKDNVFFLSYKPP